MNNDTPSTPTFLGREPVLWIAVFEAVVYVLTLFDLLNWTNEQLMGVNGLFVVILSFIVRQNVTANTNVVEFKSHRKVVAGPANDMVDKGHVVREAA